MPIEILMVIANVCKDTMMTMIKYVKNVNIPAQIVWINLLVLYVNIIYNKLIIVNVKQENILIYNNKNVINVKFNV